ncbi:hypothetical protein K1719_018618 [Acacia pycnantha]|nr:hypothetical protein K1719_018618 [Acacia pycnantha]
MTGKVTNFSTHFSFIINTQGKSFPLGDGITFFLASPGFPLSDKDGAGIGLVSRPQWKDPNYRKQHLFVAGEFDTFPNNDLDPPYDHVGIDINSLSTKYTREWFNVKDGRRYDAEINYDTSSFNLSVSFIGYKNGSRIEQNFFHIVNLALVLPEWVEFGFSSATGILHDEIHSLCSWSFSPCLDVEDQIKQSQRGLIEALSIGGGVLVCGIGLIWFMIWNIKRRRGRARSNGGFGFELISMEDEFQRIIGTNKFPHKQLVKATDNFTQENKLGAGGFGGVYKGFIEELNSFVAIKKISQGSKQGVKEYALEVKIISRLRHKNLVGLIGWCHEHNELMLVYEFMQNRSLDSHLFKDKSLLTWEQRYNIARGLALALYYLHEDCELCVVHRDKSNADEEQVLLVDWMWELRKRKSVLEAADERLCGDFNEQEMLRLMMVGLWCVHPDSILRPPIRQVVRVLKT